MMQSRGMGAISPSKMPKGERQTRRDDADFTEYKKGGLAQQAATAIAMKEAEENRKDLIMGAWMILAVLVFAGGLFIAIVLFA